MNQHRYHKEVAAPQHLQHSPPITKKCTELYLRFSSTSTKLRSYCKNGSAKNTTTLVTNGSHALSEINKGRSVGSEIQYGNMQLDISPTQREKPLVADGF